jgi:protein SCO1
MSRSLLGRCLSLVAFLGALIGPPAHTAWSAAVPVPPPPDLPQRVRFEQRLGAQLPLEAFFRDSRGTRLQLREVLAGRPTVLVLGYFRCTNLCNLVRAAVAQAVVGSALRPGEQFNVVLLSIDPRESPSDAAAAQRSDAQAHPGAHVAQWRYLTGTAAASANVASALGFHDLFDARTGQYAHAAGIAVVSGKGRVTQYLLGVGFSALTLRLALVSASQGHIGSLVDQLVLLCCAYDASTGHYSLLINRVLQGMCLLTVLTLTGLVFALRHRELDAGQEPSA